MLARVEHLHIHDKHDFVGKIDRTESLQNLTPLTECKVIPATDDEICTLSICLTVRITPFF